MASPSAKGGEPGKEKETAMFGDWPTRKPWTIKHAAGTCFLPSLPPPQRPLGFVLLGSGDLEIQLPGTQWDGRAARGGGGGVFATGNLPVPPYTFEIVETSAPDYELVCTIYDPTRRGEGGRGDQDGTHGGGSGTVVGGWTTEEGTHQQPDPATDPDR